MFILKTLAPLLLTVFAVHASAQESDAQTSMAITLGQMGFTLDAASSQGLVSGIKQAQLQDSKNMNKNPDYSDGDAISMTEPFAEKKENGHNVFRAVLVCEESLKVGEAPKCTVQTGVRSPEDYKALCAEASRDNSKTGAVMNETPPDLQKKH